jgi:hypothetical protein
VTHDLNEQGIQYDFAIVGHILYPFCDNVSFIIPCCKTAAASVLLAPLGKVFLFLCLIHFAQSKKKFNSGITVEIGLLP